MTRDRRNQSDSMHVRVRAETGTEPSAIGKLTLTQSLLQPARTPERTDSGAPARPDAPAVQRKLDHDTSGSAANAAAPRPSYNLASLFGRATCESAWPVQRQSLSPPVHAAVSQIAAAGVTGTGAALPHLDQIQASFGHHDVSGVRAHQGAASTSAARELGADAYALGTSVAFGEPPDPHTAAHEAAHVVQQRSGVQLAGGIDQPGDAYERQADAAADAAVAGRSAEALLDQQSSGAGDTHVVQRKELPEDARALESQASLKNTDVEIPALEGALVSTRLEAVTKGLLSKASFDASLALSRAMTQLQPAVAAKGAIDVGVQVQAGLAAQRLFTALQRETDDDKNFHAMPSMGPGAEGAVTEQNPYTEEVHLTTSFLVWSSTRESAGWLQQLPDLIYQGRWSDAFGGYRRLMGGLDLWVADQLRKTGQGTQDDALGNAHQHHAQLRTGLEQIADKHATRLPALFHPNAATVAKDKAAGRPAFDTVPMNVYYWRDAISGKFHLYDLTTPSRPHEQSLDGAPTPAAMVTFFEEVARYPQGEVRYTLPDGTGGIAATSGKTKWYEWLGYAGLAAAAVGLALVTAGASVAATVCFAGGALAGGVSAGGHLADSVHLGTATTATVVLDAAQIAASFVSFGVMGITVKAGSTAAALAGSRYFVPLVGATAVADTVQLVAFTDMAYGEMKQVQQGAGSPEDKQRAMAVLVTQLVAMGGLTVLSVQGARNARALAGQPLELVDQNGAKVLRVAGEDASAGTSESLVNSSENLPNSSEDRARAIRDVESIPPKGSGLDASGKPRMETDTVSLDGHSFHNDIRKLSPEARHAIRQLEERGWVRVEQIHAKDLVDISKWFGHEIGVVQSPYGRLRLILGTQDGILRTQIAKNEVFVMHTHPVMLTRQSHFQLDLEFAGKRVEAVIDWSGQITYFNKTGLKNPVQNGLVEPLQAYQAAFMDQNGNVIGFARVDIIDSPTGTRVVVRE